MGWANGQDGRAKMSVGAPLVTTAHMTPEVVPMPPQSICSIPDCNGRRRARGWCVKHWTRWQRHGDPLVTLRPDLLTGTEADRFWPKVDRADEDGCWLWTAALDQDGYGLFWDGRKTVRAHRWAYEQLHGPIPEGRELDHLCRTHACVRSSHLEPVTQRENILRGVGFAAANARKTHCLRGHEFTPENTYVREGGWRVCRQCQYVPASSEGASSDR